MIEEPPLDKSLRKLRRSTGFFSVLMVIVLSVVFASSIWTNYKVISLTTGLKHTQAHLTAVQKAEAADTTVARRASCVQFNNQQRRAITGAETGERTTINALLKAVRAPTDTPAVAAFFAIYDAQQDRNYPRRDCTPSGIAQYLNQKGN